ncbi:MAG: hypothetical protein IJY04_00640, partial [Clostridia bacterium]|nr:hypothetical protein [Clostridia bacterium]
MRKIRIFLSFALIFSVLLSLSAIMAGAETAVDGWREDEDGELRYYENGSYVTGVQNIGKFAYEFAEDGAYIGAYDAHTGVGKLNTTLQAAYEAELIALGKDKIIGYYTVDPGESYKNTSFGAANEWKLGAQNPDATAPSKGGDIYTKNDAFTSNSSCFLNVVQRYTSNYIVERAEGNYALKVQSSSAIGDGSAHSYLNVYSRTAVAGEDMVVECEFKLGEGYNYAANLFQFIDRNNIDSGAAYMPAFLKMNSEGGIYEASSSELLCYVNRNEYTRISLAVHPSENTYDVYVNGLLVEEGIQYFATNSIFDPMNFQIEEVRFAQFSGQDLGSIYIDNFAMYRALKPVNTVTEGKKSGVYLEGSVLRYYSDSKIIVGARKVDGEYLGVKFNGSNANFGTINGNGGFVIGNTATVKVNGAVKSSAAASGNLFIAPEAVSLEGGAFGGWMITDGDKKQLLTPGELYVMSSDITCEAYSIELKLLDGASVKTAEGSSSIRFMSRISKESYDALTAAGVKIEAHTLIVPTEYYDDTYGYHTLEALKSAGNEYVIDIAATEWYQTSDKYYYYTGSVDNILPEKYMQEYSGVAYLRLTYAGGESITVYADHSEENNSRSVYRIAHAAYNDRVLKSQAAYSNKITYDGVKTYSPYSADRLSVIKSFADKVIMLETELDKVVVAGDFYDAPYTVTESFNETTFKNDVTVTPLSGWSVSEAKGVVFNGEALAQGEYSIGDTCTLSLEVASEDISLLDINTESEVTQWLFMDATKDFAMFPTGLLNTDPEYCYEDGEDSAIWDYISGWGAASTPYPGARIGKYIAKQDPVDGRFYYDFSDVESLELHIYSSMDNQSVQFNLISEDPSSDGMDYYGKMLHFTRGWNTFILRRADFSSSRTPLGWDRITQVSFSANGWSQDGVNSTATSLYISDIIAFDSVVGASAYSSAELENAAVFAIGGYYAGVNGGKYKTTADNRNAVAFEENGVYYLPVAPIAAAKGFEGKTYIDSGVLCVTDIVEAVEYVLRAGNKKYTVDGVKQEFSYAPIMREGALFISLEDMMKLFGYTEKYVDRMGVIVLSGTADIYDKDADYDQIYKLAEECIYVRPTGDEIIEDFNSASGGKHPYLMINEDGFEKLRYYYVMDPTFRQYFDSIEKGYKPGTSNFKAATTDYVLTDGMRLTRNVSARAIHWAFFAKFYETIDPELSRQYAERCWIEVESGCNFFDGKVKSWNPAHYLDTAEMAYPVALAYDWLYDYWVETNDNVKTEYNADNSKTGKNYNYDGTETRLSIMEDAMYWLALATTSLLPSDTTGEYIGASYNLAGATNNWNGVCGGGHMAAALAIAGVERYAENVKTYLEGAVAAIERGMWVYAPDGGYEEGPGYWAYGTGYVQVFIACLDGACNADYGIYNAPGFAHSVYFTTYLGTKNTTWGFHDGGSGSADTDIAPWFAEKSNDPNVNAIRRQAIENGWKGVTITDILYFDPHNTTETITLDLDAYYSLDTIMTFRSSWDADTCTFAGLHGGDNRASHGDLDIGNFIINVNGTFMICDLGADAYNTDGYFGDCRWCYYRKRAEGQNTLVMRPHGDSWTNTTGNPHKGIAAESDQIKGAVSEMIAFESGSKAAYGVVDMSVAYEYMTEGKRGLWMTDGKETVVIQDEA